MALVLLHLQHLTEPGNQEQAIIRTRTEQQHGHNGNGLGVYGDPAFLGHFSEHGAGNAICKAHSNQWNQGQNRRTVDQQQEHKHQHNRCDQQGDIGVLEQSSRINGNPDRPGYPEA
ncbi:hypothetical protein D3C75_956410 [compost metagenome]